MLKSLDMTKLGRTDFIPHAIIRKPISYFENKGFSFVRDADNLDVYEGAAFLLDGLLFALKHYPGYPENTTTVYLTRDLGEDVPKITASIRAILRALDLSPDALAWERRDNPDY
jgi:hypothetical protein